MECSPRSQIISIDAKDSVTLPELWSIIENLKLFFLGCVALLSKTWWSMTRWSMYLLIKPNRSSKRPPKRLYMIAPTRVTVPRLDVMCIIPPPPRRGRRGACGAGRGVLAVLWRAGAGRAAGAASAAVRRLLGALPRPAAHHGDCSPTAHCTLHTHVLRGDICTE